MTRVRLERFELNRKTVAAIAIGRECRDMTVDAGQKAQAVAVSLSPRSHRTGKEHYADQFVVVPVIVTGMPPRWPMNRAGARLYNTSDYATEVEWGKRIRNRDGTEGGSTEGHHVMRNTLITLEATHQVDP